MAALSAVQVAQVAYQAGFRGQALVIAVAIARAESGFNPQAVSPTNGNGTVDRGLWQINSAHTQYSPSLLLSSPSYNAAAAYALSNSGSNFNAWFTYTPLGRPVGSGPYRAYMGMAATAVAALNGGGAGTTTPNPNIKRGTSNGYPKGQCTWWADERYHQLTGIYVPWAGNAKDWSSLARANGWNVSNKPVAPSIIVLQPGVQLADTTYGHVGVVERVNSDGSVYTSDQNWAGVTYPNVKYVTFKQGNGVSFVTAGNINDLAGAVNAIGAATAAGTLGSTPSFVPLIDQVHQTLIDVPGFWGIALAIDEAEQYPGFINLTSGQFDVVGMIRSVGATAQDNIIPFAIRSALILLGLSIIFALVLKIVLEGAEEVAPIVKAAL